MASKLNPFAGIQETNKYRHARTLRTNFWQKVLDTFCVLAGGIHGKWYTPTVRSAKYEDHDGLEFLRSEQHGDHVGLLDFVWPLYHPHNWFWEWVASKKPNNPDDHAEYYFKGFLICFVNILNIPKHLAQIIGWYTFSVVEPVIYFLKTHANGLSNRFLRTHCFN